MPEAVRRRIQSSTFAALERLVDLAIRERAEFVAVAGDVYDAADRSLRAQIRFHKAMVRLAEAGISAFVAHGNHDPEDGRAARLKWPEAVRFFSVDRVDSWQTIGKDGAVLARVYGISYGQPAVTENLSQRFVRAGDEPYHIAVLHANVDGDAAHGNYAPCSRKELSRLGFDYWALGHVHTRRVLQDAPPIVYPGNTQGRNIRETGPKGCYVVDVVDGETLLRFEPLDDIRWEQLELPIEGIDTEQQLKDAIACGLNKLREEAEGRAAIVRLLFTGRGSMHGFLQKEAVLSELLEEFRLEESREAERDERAPFVWVESTQVRTGAAWDREALLRQDGFAGELLRFGDGLLADEANFEAFCREALAPLHGHPKLVRLLNDMTAEERREWLQGAQEVAVGMLMTGESGGESS